MPEGKRILVAEDSPTQRMMLERLLLDHGYDVESAADGREALAAARRERPDLVVSDIMMPGMDGFGLCAALKAEGSLSDVPVILLTSLSELTDVVHALRSGADYFLTKPCDGDFIIAKVEEVLSNPHAAEPAGRQERLRVTFANESYLIAINQRRVVNLLLSTYENAVRQNRALLRSQAELEESNRRLEERADELRLAQDQLLRKERLSTLGRIAGSVAHDLRNPLGVIANSAYYLRTHLREADGKDSKHLGIIVREVERSNAIISELLDFSRGARLSAVEASLNAVVRDALADAPLPPGVALETRLDDGLPLLRLDAERVRRALLNLVSNAVEAMPGGGTLTVSTRLAGDHVELSVADTGSGIAPDDLPRIFEPLFTTRTTGVGLGLAIVRDVAEAHGGTVSVESETGRGSAFTLRLPLAAGEAKGNG